MLAHKWTSHFYSQGIRGLFRGLTPTILGILPYSGIAFALNEQGKRKVGLKMLIETAFLCLVWHDNRFISQCRFSFSFALHAMFHGK